MARAPRRLHHAATRQGPHAEHAPLPACSAHRMLCAAMCARVPRPAQHAARRTARPTRQGSFVQFNKAQDKIFKKQTAKEVRPAKKAAPKAVPKAVPKAAPACDMLCRSLPPCPGRRPPRRAPSKHMACASPQHARPGAALSGHPTVP